MPHLLTSHVDGCLQDIWEQHELHTDDDGDWPYRWGTAACWVRLVLDQAQSCVRVFAHAAHGVKGNAAVLRELNHLNGRARWVRFMLVWRHGPPSRASCTGPRSTAPRWTG